MCVEAGAVMGVEDVRGGTYLWIQGKCICTLVHRSLEGMCARTVCCVCILLPLFTPLQHCSDVFLSRLINEEIKVSVSQSRQKDIRTGIRHPAGTSEILISPFLYFPSTV